MPKLSKNIGLNELITKIKNELESTNKDSPAFFVEKAELELQVTFSKEIVGEAEGKGKTELKVQVLSVDFLKLGELEGGGKVTGKSSREDVHKITLTLTPAIGLNQEVWNRIKPDKQEEIKAAASKVVIQGDDDDI
ncbi:MAG: hypothetical protein QNJ63_10015 [Calothrix sp. MO_192.B10]|nr:hypothetical protein [Calothrix sp. MO_192.B10]